LVRQSGFHGRLQRVAIDEPVGVGGEAWIVDDRVQSGQFAKYAPVMLLIGGDAEIAIFGFKRPMGSVRRVW
jgi:hypothetical protein